MVELIVEKRTVLSNLRIEPTLTSSTFNAIFAIFPKKDNLMKLTKVRVQNYRSVEDSEEFAIGELTCLVGKK